MRDEKMLVGDNSIGVSNRRSFLKTSALFWAGLSAAGSGVLASGSSERPNIVFIIADDQDYEALSALGGEVRTPNLDRLYARGINFTHAYNQGSWTPAVCVASRVMLNTGRFLWNAQSVSGNLKREQDEGRLWSQHLRDAGYETYFTGKWHVPTPDDQGEGRDRVNSNLFDNFRKVRPGMPRTVGSSYNRPLEGEPDRWSPYDESIGGFWHGGTHWSEVLAEVAEDFIGQAAKREKPFFMYLAFNAPHDPRQSPQEYVEMYPSESVEIPGNFLPEYPHNEDIGSGRRLRDERLAPFPRTEHAVQVHRSEYYAIISHMDTQIGRILDELERHGLDENTYVIFTADHGLAVGQHGLFGKQNMYDHSVRVPMVVAGPGIERGEVPAPVYFQDIMPTTLEWAGVATPDYVDFKSLKPLIDGTRNKTHENIYGAYLNRQRMVVADNFKLILYPDISKVLLFDLAADPLETKNIAGEAQYADKIRSMFKKLLRQQEKTGDSLDLKTIYAEYAD